VPDRPHHGREEAERAGLVSRIVPAADLVDEALQTATTVAEMSLPVAMMAKEAVNRAFETTLTEGVRFERRVFHSTFATEDQKEGMAASGEAISAVHTPLVSVGTKDPTPCIGVGPFVVV
jgi:enoyl-CoA hydratase